MKCTTFILAAVELQMSLCHVVSNGCLAQQAVVIVLGTHTHAHTISSKLTTFGRLAA